MEGITSVTADLGVGGRRGFGPNRRRRPTGVPIRRQRPPQAETAPNLLHTSLIEILVERSFSLLLSHTLVGGRRRTAFAQPTVTRSRTIAPLRFADRTRRQPRTTGHQVAGLPAFGRRHAAPQEKVKRSGRGRPAGQPPGRGGDAGGPGPEPGHGRSGFEALRCLLGADVALILLDVKMPGMDGFEAAS